MKLLHVIYSLRTGGAERLVSDLCPLINRAGYEVDVLLIDGTETSFMKKLNEDGIRVLTLNKRGGQRFRLFDCLKLIPIMRGYSIVHAHLSAPQYYVAIANLLAKRRTKLVYTEHSTNNKRRKIRFLKFIELFIYRQYSKIICVSQKVKESLEKHIGVHDDKIIVVPNGANIESFRSANNITRNYLNCGNKDFVLTMVGRFVEAKDQETLIRSLPLLPEDVKLILVGDGPLKGYCQVLSEELGVDKRVVFLGIRSDVPQILRSSDVTVLSSHWEGLSLSSIEGMAVDKPFVASDVPGLHDIVSGAGLLFSEGNFEQFADIISKLKSDISFYREVADKCYRRALQYDISSTAEKYIQVYKDLTSSL